MAAETILQHWIFTNFVYPFLLMFLIIYAILEKTKLLGEDKHQINALVSFVIGLIFVGAVFPKIVVSNLILFLTVALIVMFVVLLLWGFATGGEAKIGGSKMAKWVAGILIGISSVIAVLWATGIEDKVIDLLFGQQWSSTFWTNVLFIAAVVGALALVISKSK